MIARGRDAGDVAISTAFGPSSLQSFRVWTAEVLEGEGHRASSTEWPPALKNFSVGLVPK
jgi:hypothetical protein